MALPAEMKIDPAAAPPAIGIPVVTIVGIGIIGAIITMTPIAVVTRPPVTPAIVAVTAPPSPVDLLNCAGGGICFRGEPRACERCCRRGGRECHRAQ